MSYLETAAIVVDVNAHIQACKIIYVAAGASAGTVSGIDEVPWFACNSFYRVTGPVLRNGYAIQKGGRVPAA